MFNLKKRKILRSLNLKRTNAKNEFKNFIVFVLFAGLFSIAQAKPKLSTKEINKIKSTKILIQELLAGKTKKTQSLKVKTCPFNKAKWTMLLIAKQEFTQSLSFSKKCDLQGKFIAKRDKSFPLKLKIQNHKEIHTLELSALIKLEYEPKPAIKLNILNAIAQGPDTKIKFKADYSVLIDPFSQKVVKKDLGGKIVIQSINSKLINETYPIKAK